MRRVIWLDWHAVPCARACPRAPQVPEECQKHATQITGPAAQSHLARMEAFAYGALTHNQLMRVKEKMHISDLGDFLEANGRVVHKKLGWNQHFLLTKEQLGTPAGDKHAVLLADHKTLVIADRTLFENHRRQRT